MTCRGSIFRLPMYSQVSADISCGLRTRSSLAGSRDHEDANRRLEVFDIPGPAPNRRHPGSRRTVPERQPRRIVHDYLLAPELENAGRVDPGSGGLIIHEARKRKSERKRAERCSKLGISPMPAPKFGSEHLTALQLHIDIANLSISK